MVVFDGRCSIRRPGHRDTGQLTDLPGALIDITVLPGGYALVRTHIELVGVGALDLVGDGEAATHGRVQDEAAGEGAVREAQHVRGAVDQAEKPSVDRV